MALKVAERAVFLKTINRGIKGKRVSALEANRPSLKKGISHGTICRLDQKELMQMGYVDIKIADPNKWKGKHILIWEELHGPVPKGHAVIFADGNNRNFDPENLLLVSRKQLVRMNQRGLIQNDAELTKTGVIIADIYNKIGEAKRKSKERRDSH